MTINDLAQTINDLAQVTANGFAEVHEKFDNKIDGLRAEMQQGFSSLRSEIKSKFDEVKEEIVELREEVKHLSLRTKEDADAVAQDVLVINRRLDDLEKRVSALQIA